MSFFSAQNLFYPISERFGSILAIFSIFLTFSRKIFFACFSDQKMEKNSKKWKIWKIAKNGPNFKNFEKCPKSFRNWVKPIMGTKNDNFREEFFFARFSDQKLGKISKKKNEKKKFKNFEKGPKLFRNWVKPIMGTKNNIFRENFFSPVFQTKKRKKIQKKWKKNWKIARNGPNFKNFEQCPKSFRNWVKPIMGTKKWDFLGNFSPIFQAKKTRKNFRKKWKKLKKLPKLTQIVQKLGKTNFGHWKMTFFGEIFFAHFSDQKTRKTFKKLKNLNSCQKWPKF